MPMARKKPPSPNPPELDALKKIQIGLEELPEQFQNAFRPGRQLLFNYAKGIASGLGVITAFAIIIPLIVWFLQRIQWVPLIGDFVSQVAVQVEEARRR